MKKPTNIINTPPSDNESWGSYNAQTKQWSEKVYSGKAVREWILDNIIKLKKINNLYGPYESIEDALEIPQEDRKLGLTIGIIENGEVIEYQWKKGIENNDLELKIEKVNLTISPVGETIISKKEGEIITILFNISGRATLLKGFLYLVINQSEIYIGEFSNLGKGDNSIQINNIDSSGIYYYRIKILDSSGAYATSNDGKDYIEYEIRYGGISTLYNFTKLNTILIKNIYSVAGLYFTCNISIRDNSFNILEMVLTDGDLVNIPLIPCDSLGNPSGTYLGNNYYYLPDSNTLQALNGKTCYLNLNYTENGEPYTSTNSLFTLLDISSLELIPESGTRDYYLELPTYFSFLLLSGVENISTTLSKHQDSDFDFETVTVASYRRFSLKIIPNKIKENAIIKLNYSFYYNNIEYTGTFTLTLGNILSVPEQNYYEPAQGETTIKDNIIYSDEEDYDIIEDGQYYKIINSDVVNEYYSCAFLIDMYCRINKINNKSLKYLTITYGNEEIGYINEDAINCRGIKSDTPLDEWTQIGLGYNVKESIERDSITTDAFYFSIYVNGMIVKNILIDGLNVKGLVYNPLNKLSIKLSNGIEVQKCFIYYKNNGSESILPNTTTTKIPIIYNNYLSHNLTFVEPSELPELKLMKILDQDENIRYFNLINSYKEAHELDLIKHTTTFGTIGLKKALNMSEYKQYDVSEDIVESKATLFRQSVNIKKPALKDYVVLCRGQYISNGINLLEGVLVEVHTQGTSTLVYSVPNFKFIFWKENGNEIEPYYPTFIKKSEEEGTITYYHEYVYTAKADYMDSSHLNNTPTCNYYNNVILDLISEGEIVGSPSARNGGIDAIMGFPIIMEVSDTADNFDTYFNNIGSFMLNIDKTGESLGFEVLEDGVLLNCISFEGTSNDNEHGSAGRFILVDNRLSYFLDDEEIDSAYNEVKAAINNKQIDEPGSLDPIGDLTGYPYAQWCQFISDGLEYRYPDSDIIKSKSGKLSKVMKLNDFKKLYKMWSWVSQSDEYDRETYKREFEDHFDLKYCILYFIQLMIFGQTDNLGKNAMFDCWDGEHWYPRPYDLDSLAGLDNNGNDNIAPFVEIKPEFSLNWNSSYTEEEKRENYLLENSLILYGNTLYDRYHYSSNTSKLWINFYKNFKDEIESFYLILRNRYNYSADSIIELCKNLLIDVLGISQYNQDFNNKYLANSDLALAYGNRWYKFKKWLKLRFAFCDSYFGASESAIYSATSAFNYNVKIDSPQYVVQQYQQSKVIKFVIDQENFSAGSSAATKTTLKVNQPSVLETTLFKYVSRDNGSNNFTGLINLDVSGNTHIPGITGLVGSYLPDLRELNISNSSVNTLSVPIQLKKLTANNVILNQLDFVDNSLIEEISLKNSTINSDINFSNLPNLKKLDLTGCKIKSNITLANLGNLQTFIIEDASFEGDFIIQDGVNINEFDFTELSLNNISFSGSNLLIKTLNFHKTIFGLTRINLNAISRNIENLYFDECTVLEHLEVTNENTFDSLKVFSIANSSITAIGNNSTLFDASVFPNISELKRVSNYGLETISTTPFTFLNTNISKIVNFNWNGSGAYLFYNCTKLTSIEGILNLTDSINYMFYRCPLLSTLPTINISDSVTTAVYSFTMNNSLGYNNIASVIRKCTKVIDFSNACRCTKFSDDLLIDLDYLFENNSDVTTITSMFTTTSSGIGGLISTTNTFVLRGKIPQSLVRADSAFYGVTTIKVPYNIFSDATNLESVSSMFATCNITFTGDNLPTYMDSLEQVISLTNTVNSDFFPTSIKSLMGLFYSTNVLIINTDVFNRLSNLENCASVFGGRLRKFYITDSLGNIVDINLNILNLWANNPRLNNVAGCFNNVYNIYCTGLNFHENVTSIDISGLFSLSSSTYKNYLRIIIDIDSIVPNITTDNYYIIPGGRSTYYGVFLNREVYISSNENSILSKLTTECRLMFYNSTIYVNNSVEKFDLSNVKNTLRMFRNCNLYKHSSEENHIYGDSDRYFVNIDMPTSCTIYSEMFYNSIMLLTLPNIRSSSASDFSYTYASCYINQTEVRIPYNYFDICKNNIKNVSYMFYNNRYITELLYNESKGLFEDCILLSNVNNMFNGCWFLHKGIPNNIFGTQPIPFLTSLTAMFRDTSLFYDIDNDSYKWVDINTFSPLINLTSIEQLFSYIKIGNSTYGYGTLRNIVKNNDEDVYIIAPNTFTFKNISNIRRSFKHSLIDVPFEFSGFEYSTEAFFDCNILEEISSNFVFELNVSAIRDVSRMFYDIPQSTSRRITNLGIFVSKISEYNNIQKAYIAGNLINEDIDSSLKADNPSVDTDIYHGHSLTNRTFYNN